MIIDRSIRMKPTEATGIATGVVIGVAIGMADNVAMGIGSTPGSF
jgi:hypothetical protein